MPADAKSAHDLTVSMFQKTNNEAMEKRQQLRQAANQTDLLRMQSEFNTLMQIILSSVPKDVSDPKKIHDFKGKIQHAIHQFPADEQGKPRYSSVEEALNLVQSPYGKGLLETTLDEQQFSAAQFLLNGGVRVGTVEQEAFNQAATSDAGQAYGLRSHARQELHTVKKYGLVLGLKVSAEDGTFSQKAFISPTLSLMNDKVKQHAEQNPDKPEFQKISQAFDAAEKIGQYTNSKPQNPKAGHEMKARIEQGELTNIPIRCNGHVMGLSVIPDQKGGGPGYIVFTNRGVGARFGEQGTDIYRVDDVSKIDPNTLMTIMNGKGDRTHDEVMQEVAKLTNSQPPVMHLKQPPQSVDNCTIANPTSNVEGMLVVLKAQSLNKEVSELTQDELQSARTSFQEFSQNLELNSAKALAEDLRQNPSDPDLIQLAKACLTQRPDAQPAIKTMLCEALEGSDYNLNTRASMSMRG